MPIVVAHKATKAETLRRLYGDPLILDVSSRGPDPWRRFSPFFPHGGIPIPLSPGHVSQSVEGIWQGLKVFENEDVDPSKFTITSMKGLKRSVRKHGRVLGHRAGVKGETLLRYGDARRALYLPSYAWVIEHRLGDLIDELVRTAPARTVVLLDYETNADIEDLSRPLSHAALVKRHVEAMLGAPGA